MKKIFFIFIFFTFSLINNSLAYSSDPQEFISEVVVEAKNILTESNSKEYKTKKLSDLALKTVDIKGVAFYTLGKYKKNLKDNQLEEFLGLFEKYFLKTFASRLTDYSDTKINVIDAKILNEKYTIVKSILVSTDKKPEVKIDWRIYTKNPEKPLIRDLIIEGLSLARTEKEQFSSIIESSNGDFTKLLDTLRKFTAE